MARLIDWPVGLKLSKMTPLSGPRSVGSVSTESISGWVQTNASPFGLQRWQFVIPFARKKELRELRGLITALHGGANAVRFTFIDPDRHWNESGFSAKPTRQFWSNDEPWGNSARWTMGPPAESVTAAASVGDVLISLGNSHWRDNLGVGDWLGFFPFHFGLYWVTRVLDDGQFQIWPPLDAALTTSDFATLEPTMVMKLESENSGVWSRDTDGARDSSLTLVQVEDADVREYFAD